MKQRLIICLALVATLLSACKNKDIDITREVTFDVNPYTIVSDFARFEVNPGDLVSFKYDSQSENFRLRTYLLIYDSDGDLYRSVIEDKHNFNEHTTASFELPDGSYTVVALAHIYNKEDDVVYWFVQDMNRLEDLKVSNNENYYDTWIKLMGITSTHIEVAPGFNKCNVDIQPAVALMQGIIRDIHYYTDMLAYLPYADKMSTSISFNRNAEYSAAYEESDSFDYQLIAPFITSYYPGNNVYWYNCFSTMGTTNFLWLGVSEDDVVYTMGGSRSANIQAGKVFRSVLNLSGGSFEINEMGKDGAQPISLEDVARTDELKKVESVYSLK